MATLEELMRRFGGNSAEDDDSTGYGADEEDNHHAGNGATKIASGGDSMNSLQDIYLAMADHDLQKEAAYAAEVPDNDDFAKMAAAIAEAEADEIVGSEYQDADEEVDIIKVASEYDAAGRIMARGFYDEFQKLAGNLDTEVSPNQMTESPSSASTPSLGDRGLPTVETNFAGNEAHDGKIETAMSSGVNPKDVHKDINSKPV